MVKPKKVKKGVPKVVLEDEPWLIGYWRPMMAWQYFIVCICDFIVFPSLAMYYATNHGMAENFKWDPITLSAGGFYHIAMGVIIGVTAYTRGQENLLRTRMFASLEPPPPPSSEECDDDDLYIDEGLEPPAHPTTRPQKGG